MLVYVLEYVIHVSRFRGPPRLRNREMYRFELSATNSGCSEIQDTSMIPTDAPEAAMAPLAEEEDVDDRDIDLVITQAVSVRPKPSRLLRPVMEILFQPL